ncbi:FAD/NAD(P)-binding domain-containing protein [Wolfiporia cocos MD-104 SS10]|uniref:FAD/NAD(P)-binding domain-containing protein n=1 Tax=Wolfiporia cocos (strain MD-104) TaxID=742152 RepID=A0A2H3JKJ0_WOLCO|nr:FAD/NAD(P)-binding domain-containing protein [Wolfiporia cocos MD-104 SS10]
MVNILQLVFSVVSLVSFWRRPEDVFESLHDGYAHLAVDPSPEVTKSIAIVGAGSAGLGALKALLDLPEEVREGWEIVLYEARRDVGGLWLADPPGYEPTPPNVPETPMYPRVHTNTPHTTMTYPHFPFRPGTPLYPSWEHVQTYHADYAAHYNLTPYINLNHTVVFAKWHSHDGTGDWHVETHAQHGNPGGEVVIRRTFDHLVVAVGHNRFPHIPTWEGTDGWLTNTPADSPTREIVHSVYYREPAKYANMTVIMVGSGTSARDIAQQIEPLARVVYQSVKDGKPTAPDTTVIPKPAISYFTNDSIVFEDGTALYDVDAVILATGYDLRVPFLSEPQSSVMLTDASPDVNCTTAPTLTDNLRYIFPLYQQIFNLAPTMPPTALTFVGLPMLTSQSPTDYAQGLLISHAFANESLLPSREEMLQNTVEREEALRAKGVDPYYDGHRMVLSDTEPNEYQDNLIEYLKQQGAIPDDGQRYVEEWRWFARANAPLLVRAWKRVQKLEEEDEWIAGIETEEEWADLMVRLAHWQSEWEREHPSRLDSSDIVPNEWLYG